MKIHERHFIGNLRALFVTVLIFLFFTFVLQETHHLTRGHVLGDFIMMFVGVITIPIVVKWIGFFSKSLTYRIGFFMIFLGGNLIQLIVQDATITVLAVLAFSLILASCAESDDVYEEQEENLLSVK